MAQTVLITLFSPGADTGPFDLYSNIDGFFSPFETGVSKTSLSSGYSSSLVPDGASVIRVKSISALCSNYSDLDIVTSTTTTTSSSTTTTTTTEMTYSLFWSVNSDGGKGSLVVFPTSTPGSPLVNQSTTGNFSGTVALSPGISYTIRGNWGSGSGNIVKFRVCDVDSGTEIYYSPDITVGSPQDNYIFTIPILPYNHISVALRSNGVIPPVCVVP